MSIHHCVSGKLLTSVTQLTKSGLSTGRVTVVSFLHKSTTTKEAEPPPDEDPSTGQTPYPPGFPTHDWIGPVDSKSNLRRVQFAHPVDESEAEERYRLLREGTHAWNQEFWSKHNEEFKRAKQQFTREMFAFQGKAMLNEDGTKNVLTAEELAEFYTDFLEQHRDSFGTYNREWYKMNLYMLWPATHATVAGWWRTLKSKQPSR